MNDKKLFADSLEKSFENNKKEITIYVMAFELDPEDFL